MTGLCFLQYDARNVARFLLSAGVAAVSASPRYHANHAIALDAAAWPGWPLALRARRRLGGDPHLVCNCTHHTFFRHSRDYTRINHIVDVILPFSNMFPMFDV